MPQNRVTRFLNAIRPATTILLMVTLLYMPSMSRGADIPVYIYCDLSPSARAGDVADVLKDFSSRLSHYKGNDPLVITLTPFFQSAFLASPAVSVTIPGTRKVDCSSAVDRNELAYLSRSYAESAKSELLQHCAAVRTQARQQEAAQRSAAIAKLDETNRFAQLRSSARNSVLREIRSRA